MPLSLDFEQHVRAGFAGIWIRSSEHDEAIREIAKVCSKKEWSLLQWDCDRGMVAGDEGGDGESDPIPPLTALRSADDANPIILIMRNLSLHMDDPALVQTLENTIHYGKANARFVVVLSHTSEIRKEVEKSFVVLEHDLPDREQLLSIAAGLEKELPEPSEVDRLLDSAGGLTAMEAEGAFSLSWVKNGGFDPSVVWNIKAGSLKKAGTLELYRGDETFDDLGGLDSMKDFCKRALSDKSDRAKARGVLLLGVPGCGKCLGRGTPVLKHDGSIVAVEDVKVGDKLMGPDSNPRTVLNVCAGCGPLYRVNPVKGDPYVVNNNHILSLKRTSRRHGEVVNLSIPEFLSKGNASREKLKGWRTGVDFPSQPIELDPYILGLWLGNGDIQGPRITTPFQEVVDEMKLFCNKNGLHLTVYREDETAPSYRLSSRIGSGSGNNWVLNFLRSRGLTTEKHIPKDYLTNDRTVRLELLAGLIDTDGYFNGGYEIVQKSERLANEILFLARSLGFAAYSSLKNVPHPETSDDRWYHRITISGNVFEIPVRTTHRKAPQRKQAKSVLVTGVEVEPIEAGDFFGFEIDGDHLFLLGDFTVTHNSQFCKALGNEVGRPTITLDFGALMGSLVGQTEERTREALRIVDRMAPAVLFVDEIEKGLSGAGGGSNDSGVSDRMLGTLLTWLNDHKSDVFFVASCNNIEALTGASAGAFTRAERFDGIFFIDLPDEKQRGIIWEMYLKMFDVKGKPGDVDDTGWTGAEIKSCCRMSALLDMNLEQAAQYVVPVCHTAGPQIAKLRDWADGRAIDANRKGIYRQKSNGAEKRSRALLS